VHIKTWGPEHFLRMLLEGLEEPNSLTRMLPVNKSYSQTHRGIVTKEQFIQAGAIQIRDHLGPDKFLTKLLDNLQREHKL
jgi:hypothetical protein